MEMIIRKKVEQKAAAENLSISEIERQAGLKQGVLRNILRGKSKNPTVQVLMSLAKVLNCSIEELIGASKPVNNTPDNEEKVLDKNDLIDYQLLGEAFKMAVSMSQNTNKRHSLDKLFEIVSDLYEFSNKGRSRKPNINFCEWLFEKID